MVELDRFAHTLLEAAPDAVIVTDAEGHIVLLNVQAELLLGYDREELKGRHVDALVPQAMQGQHTKWRAQQGHGPMKRVMGGLALELLAIRRDGTLVPVEITLAPVSISGHPYTISVMRDLTERRRIEEHLLYVSSHDTLTGLANRSAFDEALAQLDERGPHPVGVVMVDLDGLKDINDQLGHAAGDLMLRRVAHVLRVTFRAGDVVARIGGDEFAVLTAGRDAAAVEVLAGRLQDAVESHNSQLHTGKPLKLSVGVAVADSGVSVAAALQDADARMYTMKRAHHGR